MLVTEVVYNFMDYYGGILALESPQLLRESTRIWSTVELLIKDAIEKPLYKDTL